MAPTASHGAGMTACGASRPRGGKLLLLGVVLLAIAILPSVRNVGSLFWLKSVLETNSDASLWRFESWTHLSLFGEGASSVDTAYRLAIAQAAHSRLLVSPEWENGTFDGLFQSSALRPKLAAVACPVTDFDDDAARRAAIAISSNRGWILVCDQEVARIESPDALIDVVSLVAALGLPPGAPGDQQLSMAISRASWTVHDRGSYAAAVTGLELATRLQPSFPDARVLLGSALLDDGRMEEATSVLQSELEQRPGSALVWQHWGSLLLRKHQLAQAEQALTKSIELQTQDSWPFYLLSIAQEQLGECGNAQASASIATQRNPGSALFADRVRALEVCKVDAPTKALGAGSR